VREQLVVRPLEGYPMEIGGALWAMQAVRRMTLDRVRQVSPKALEWEGPDGREDSIGSLLYHIALVEMDWLFLDIHETALPPEIAADLPHPMAMGGRLTRVTGETLESHLGRLDRTRRRFLDEFRGMTLGDWRRERTPADTQYSATPEWIVFHLVEHEAGHGAQIGSLVRRAAVHVAEP
jgi:uncharacterized damage-inducible protein DinB